MGSVDVCSVSAVSMKLKRSGGTPLWEWGCYRCDPLTIKEGGEARTVVAAARRHTRETGHATWLHNILMWDIWVTERRKPEART